MEVKLPVFLGNYDRSTDRPTYQPTDRRTLQTILINTGFPQYWFSLGNLNNSRITNDLSESKTKIEVGFIWRTTHLEVEIDGGRHKSAKHPAFSLWGLD